MTTIIREEYMEKEDERQDPDKLLQMIKKEEKAKTRGHLKIFFGYAAGVGKTYAMLKAAHTAKRHGIDIVAGYVEPHPRPDTAKLLEGLEVLPPLELNYNGLSLKEFDLDAAIKRKPKLILVDELAHTSVTSGPSLWTSEPSSAMTWIPSAWQVPILSSGSWTSPIPAPS